MPNLNTLDTLIAIAVVMLTLSLVVQAVQSVIKKLFKIKSRQLEESLVDLFENVLGSKSATDRFRLPTLKLLPFTKQPAALASPEVRDVFEAVMKEFQEIGRVASSGKRMLDSISKEDLMKVLRKVGPDALVPNTLSNLNAACGQLSTLRVELSKIQTDLLSGEASAKFAKMQESLAPLINDIQCVFNGSQLNANILLADLLNLRDFNLSDVFDLLGEVQGKVGEDLAAEMKATPDSERAAALSTLDQGLKNIANALGELRQKFDAAVAPLRVKLGEVENWYDTVMQSFEERYNRGMKSYAFALSLFVAVWLNANALGIYRDVSTNTERRAAILELQDQTLEVYSEQMQEATNAGDPGKVQDILRLAKEQVDRGADLYGQFGFTPLSTDYRKLTESGGAWDGTKQILYMLCGWLLTAALLSLGAPFWHDTLESLFGIKNLLRKKGNIKNVEAEAGAGQPKP